jgi:hypothetical protein
MIPRSARTPAISDGLLVVRTMKHVYGLGEPPPIE